MVSVQEQKISDYVDALLHGERGEGYDEVSGTIHLNSLLLVRIRAEIQRQFAGDTDILELRDCATKQQLVEYLNAVVSWSNQCSVPAIEEHHEHPRSETRKGTEFRLTTLQQAYVLGKQTDNPADNAGCHLYREISAGNIDSAKIKSAWAKTIASQEALRLVVTDEGTLRLLQQPSEPEIRVNHFESMAEPDIGKHLDEIRSRLSHKRYAPEEWPKFTVEVSLLPDEQCLLHISIDGLITDGPGLYSLLGQWRDYCLGRDPVPTGEERLETALAELDNVLQEAGRSGNFSYWESRLAGLQNHEKLCRLTQGLTIRRQTMYRRLPLAAKITVPAWKQLTQRAADLNVSPTALVLGIFVQCLDHWIDVDTALPVMLTTNNCALLSADTTGLAGPFTDTLPFLADLNVNASLDELAVELHRKLCSDMNHAAVGGVSILRHLKKTGVPAAALNFPIVFTSMLGLDYKSRIGQEFESIYSVSQTSGVVLDHQMWEENGQLCVHWDAVPEVIGTGDAETLFADFVNRLEYAGIAEAHTKKPLNGLQKAYFVARQSSPLPIRNGCQVYFSFDVPELDMEKLSSAWMRMLCECSVLRSCVDEEGQISTLEQAPGAFAIPEISLDYTAGNYLHELPEQMASKAFPVGKWPAFDIRATDFGNGLQRIHITIDLIIADGISLHLLCREFLRDYMMRIEGVRTRSVSEQSAVLPRARTVVAGPVPENSSYWSTRFENLPAGPEFISSTASNSDDPASDSDKRIRLQAAVSGWNYLERHADSRGVSGDMVLLALLAEVVSRHQGRRPLTIPVVVWDRTLDDRRPEELTMLSWVSFRGQDAPVMEVARHFQNQIERDLAAGSESGLEALRKTIMKRRREENFSLPLVYTSVLDLSGSRLPDSVTQGPWMTYTPDVSLDVISMKERDELTLYWDAVPGDFPGGLLDGLFEEYRCAVTETVAHARNASAGELHLTLGELAVGQHASASVSGNERDKVLYEWNHTEAHVSLTQPVHELFERAAVSQPKAIAVRSADAALAYDELNRLANQIAWMLLSIPLHEDTVVAIRLSRTPLLLASVFGVLKAGGVYVPIEIGCPDARMGDILEQSEASVLLTDAPVDSTVVPGQCLQMDIGVLTDLSTFSDENPVGGTDSRNRAYIIFTSGSTGRPKGVAVTHGSLLNLLSWTYRYYNFSSNDVGLSTASIGFDLSVFDIFGLLACGGSMYLASHEEQRDPALLTDILIRERISFWNSAPAVMAQLAGQWSEISAGAGTEHLRLVFLSGDFTPLWLPAELSRVFPNARLVNLGGATEATVWSNYYEVKSVDQKWRSIPYGRPIDNSRYYILQDDLEPCSIEVEGDLFIAGDCLSLGYINQARLTAEAFIPDPFSREPGGRLYRTGDRAKYMPCGNIELLGRKDNQVKIRGFRIELDEIRYRINQCPGVKDCALQVLDAANANKRLMAYVIAASSEASPASVKKFVSRTLPDYMVPSFVEFVTSFPMTVNGKLDLNALARQGKEQAPGVNTDESHDRLEQLRRELIGLFLKDIGGESLVADKDLWDQGATSFSMVQVSNGLFKKYGQRIPVSTLVENPTVDSITLAIASSLGVAAEDAGSEVSADALPSPSLLPSPSTSSSAELRASTAAEPVQPGTAETDVDAELPPHIDLLDKQAVEHFKQQRHDLLIRDKKAPGISLADFHYPLSYYSANKTHREFARAVVEFSAISRFLALLRERSGNQVRHLYPSAGGTYAVQVYLHIKPGAVQGVAEGVYYYHPVEHRLCLINEQPQLSANDHFFYNRAAYEQCAFSIFLIGQRLAIAPLYGEQSRQFLMLEAGYVGQLLMTAKQSLGLALCPIGTMSSSALETQLKLKKDQLFLQAFLAGTAPVDEEMGFCRQLPYSSANNQVAIIGMAGRYAGAATPGELWDCLNKGQSLVKTAPAARRGLEGLSDDLRVGGFLDQIDEFDSRLFHIAPKEADKLDPQIRLLLETTWESLENAGYTAESLRRSARDVGVFVAAMWHDFQNYGAEMAANGDAMISAFGSDIANRLSHFFNFDGPSITVDTACSSSLAAFHLARESLASGDCDVAIVAAVNVVAHPYHLQLLAGHKLLGYAPLSAFDARAKGWLPGEGVGVYILRPLDRTTVNNDRIAGIIEASRISHSGRTARYASPDATALARSIEYMINESGIGLETIDYIECAAAGSSLADIAELEALNEVFSKEPNSSKIPVGTIKPCLGHLESASGASQLAKVLLQMDHKTLAPNPVALDSHALVNWSELRLVPNSRVDHWASRSGGQGHRALINGLSASGSYAHLLIRSPDPVDNRTSCDDDSYVIVLSAGSSEQLRQCALRLKAFLSNPVVSDKYWLADVAYTLQVGRVALSHRMAAELDSLDELEKELHGFLNANESQRWRHAVAAVDSAGPSVTPSNNGDIISAWLSGQNIDWVSLWQSPARRVELPTYPFARECHWPVLTLRETELQGPGIQDIELREKDAVSRQPDRAHGVSMIEYLAGLIAAVTGIPSEHINGREPLENLGLTSAMIVELNQHISEGLGIDSPTLFFEFKSVSALAEHLSSPGNTSRLSRKRPAGVANGTPVSDRNGDGNRDMNEAADGAIAIIGMAGRFPRADSLEEFWERLKSGDDCVRELPAGRRRAEWPTAIMQAGFLDQVDCFDPLFFQISPRDANFMDPQERLFLETAWHALEDAGYSRRKLQARHGESCGVFVGSMYNEYPFFGIERSRTASPVASGSAIAGIANRVSYFLDLHGPSMTIDTMCSSSLTAIHLAVESLRSGSCSAALAGGVNLCLHPNKFIQLDQLQMAAEDFRCRSFGAGGTGFVPGEGVGVLLLKPLKTALTDGDRIHAVIRCSTINHGGRSNGYMVPDPAAQAALIENALADSGIDPCSVGYIEAHGTGTALGDPVEISGLERAYGMQGIPQASCAIGSVKSNIGHLEAAAGIAGVTKLILQMQHRTLVPSLHAAELNPNINWENSAFHVQRELAEWVLNRNEHDGRSPLRGAVNSFGAGGANAHIILESFEQTPAVRQERSRERYQLIVLSARTEGDLHRLVKNLKQRLQSVNPADEPIYFESLAYTLQEGREALVQRLGVIAPHREELIQILSAYLSGEHDGVIEGRAMAEAGEHEPENLPENLLEGADIDALRVVARSWVNGSDVDWQSLYPNRNASVVSLPNYPFNRVPCWIPEARADEGHAAEMQNFLYHTRWQESASVTDSRLQSDDPLPARVLCIYAAVTKELAVSFSRLLEARRCTCSLLALPDLVPSPGNGTGGPCVDLPGDLGEFDCIVDLADASGDPAGDNMGGVYGRISLLQEYLRCRRTDETRFVHVTRGMRGPGACGTAAAGIRMSALLPAVAGEFSRLHVSRVDLDPGKEGPPQQAARLIDEFFSPDQEAEVCYRSGKRHVPRLQSLPESSVASYQADPDKVYIVTGGTRGLGAKVARWLCSRGARKILLMARHALPPRETWQSGQTDELASRAISTILELESQGASVEIHGGALTDAAELKKTLASVRRSLGQIEGVIHCAGRPSQGSSTFIAKTRQDFDAVWEPKISGLEELIRSLEEDEISFFVAFSSVSAVFPGLGAGVSDYASANAYMDLRAGIPIGSAGARLASINWPVWRDNNPARRYLEAGSRFGLETISDQQGWQVMDRVLAGSGEVNTVVCPTTAPTDIDALRSSTNWRGKNRVEEAEVPSELGGSADGTVGDAAKAWLAPLVGEILAIPVSELAPDLDFGEIGMESVAMAELLTRIEEKIGSSLHPSVFLDYPNLNLLAEYLEAGFPDQSAVPVAAPAEEDAQPRSRPPARAGTATADGLRASRQEDGRIAIVGMSARLPGANNLDAFWDNLSSAICSVSEVPSSRWDTNRLYATESLPHKSISKWGGFVEGLEEFDPGYFKLSSDEGKDCDPSIRLVLEEAVNCTRDAGYQYEAICGGRVGAFIGARMSGYRQRVAKARGSSGIGGGQNFIASYLSQYFDLRGPNMVIDSACSSSLVSIHLACQSLRNKECDMALSGGVDILLDEEPYIEFSRSKALSPRGRCATFDKDADGFVPGEGCGLVLLKPLARALEDGDRIYAVIRGSAVNSDGQTMGATTPNPASQAEVVRRALSQSGLSATDIGLLEAHGTGTKIGDPIELQALSQVYGEQSDATGYCAIGSVKSNIGHLFSAAGIAGLLKAVLALRHEEIPRTVCCDHPNPRFDFASSPFYPALQREEWKSGRGVRAAGVSAFGLGGTNAHLIVSDLGDEPELQTNIRRQALSPAVFKRRRLWFERKDLPDDASLLHWSHIAESAPSVWQDDNPEPAWEERQEEDVTTSLLDIKRVIH